MIEIRIRCVRCKKEYLYQVTPEQYSRWTSGKGLIQDIFPDWKPEDREMLISQICPKCWSELFGGLNYDA